MATGTITKTLLGILIVLLPGPDFSSHRPTNPMFSRLTVLSKPTPMATGLGITPTATEPMLVQMLGVILNTTVLAALMPILTDILTQRLDGPAPRIVLEPTPSLMTLHSGAMKTTTALAAIQMATKPMLVQTIPALQRLTESVALTEMAMAIPMRETRSPMTQRNGPTEMAITEATTRAVTTLTLSQMTRVNGRTAMATATGITRAATTATPSLQIPHNGAMKMGMATAITPMGTSEICVHSTMVNHRLNSAAAALTLTLTA